MVLASIVVFLVSLAIGALGIHLGAMAIVEESEYSDAVVTALIGAIVWAVVGFFLGVIPLVGPLLALLAWIAVINMMYPGGWTEAAGIGLIAWVSVLVVLYILALFEVTAFTAIGVPGT